jgi:hypothetical protein
MGPFLNLAPSDFDADMAGQIVKNSKHEAINRELRLISGRLERAARVVDDTEQLLGATPRWQRSDADYQKTIQYISNKEYVRRIFGLWAGTTQMVGISARCP